MSGPGRGLPRLHVVTDDPVLARPDFLRIARSLLEEGGPDVALHVRGPHSTGASVYERVSGLTEVARSAGALLVVNDRVDVALATGIGAVHLGARSLKVDVARSLMGSDAVIGCSTHDLHGVAAAVRDGASFVFFGNVYETASHPGREGRGPGGLRSALEAAVAMPVLGIGGVSVERATDVVAMGAHGVAVLRGVWASDAPTGAVSDYISALGR